MNLACALSFLLHLPAGAAEAPAATLESLLEQARSGNPAILAARKRWESAEALVLPARTWRDPVIGLHREDFPADSERSIHYSVEQEVPFPGKLSTESRMRHHEAGIAREEYRARELEVLSEVKVHYHKLLYLDRTAAALRKDAEVLRGIVRVAQSQVSAGRAGAEEALIAQTNLKQVENAAFEREQQRAIEEEDLNALLGAPPGSRRALSGTEGLPDVPAVPESLADMARETSPTYLGTLHMARHAELMTVKGRLGFAPDFKLSFEKERFQRRADETLYGLSLTIPLWFWRPMGELRSAREHTAQALAEVQDARNAVFKELYKEYTEVRLHRSLALSYAGEILPLAEGALKIAQKNYETGRTDFPKLAYAVRNLLEAQMKYYEEAYHYGEHWAMLERIVGRELPAGGAR